MNTNQYTQKTLEALQAAQQQMCIRDSHSTPPIRASRAIKISRVSSTGFPREAGACAQLPLCLPFCAAPFPCFALIKATSFLPGMELSGYKN